MCMGVLAARIYVHHRGQKRKLEPFELEVRMVVNRDAGNQTWVLYKSNKGFLLLSNLSTTYPNIF